MGNEKKEETKKEASGIDLEVKPEVMDMIEGKSSKTQEKAPAEKSVSADLTLIEKVELMSDLTSACKNKELVGLMKNMPNGDRIFNLFMSAVEREVSVIMSGKEESVSQEVVNLMSYTKQLQGSIDGFRGLIVGFMNTPLVQVLNLLNQNLGGKKYDLDSSISSIANTRAEAPNQQQFNNNPAPPQHYPSGGGGGGRSGPSVLGSF
jgi:hypothetical protein